MRKLTECLIVLAFLLCAFTTAQAAPDIDVSVPSAGEPCTSDLSCGPGELCINEICSATQPCTNDLQCDSGELCIDEICQEGECVNDEDCEGDLICDTSTYTCLECRTWTDCDQKTEICSDENTCVPAEDCDLRINPKKISITAKNNAFKTFKLRIKGNENFTNPVIPIGNGDFFLDYEIEPFVEKGLLNRWYNKNRVLEMVVWVDTDQESDDYTLRFGKCLGVVEIKNKLK